MVVYLVRSFRTNARIRSLTTGTFNRVVKDRIAIRLSGANSGLDGAATRANPAVLETIQTYVAAQDPVNASVPQNFHVISTMGIRGGGAGVSSTRSPKAGKPYGLSFRTGEAGEESAFAYQEHRRGQRYGLPLQRRSFRRTPKRKTEN